MPKYHPPTVIFESFTPKTLQPFNGKDNERILLAINGIVFDVTAGRSFYGPGGMYGNFAGRDASRGMAKQSFDVEMLTPIDRPLDKLEDLKQDEIDNMKGWIDHFSNKYIGTANRLASLRKIFCYASKKPDLSVGQEIDTSQTLWTLSDIWIAGRQVSNMEQADDGATFSSPEGVQAHLYELGPWTCRKALQVNIQKTKSLAVCLVRYRRLHEWTNEHKYLGVTFTSSHANIFKTHYGIKAKAARKIATATFILDEYLGDLPPHGAEVLWILPRPI
ncbi:cytochrome b5-like heme/steroid binding domain-containing protein [Armillaria nabsnona]|nr:cytochrome b5-like heme/steroid binding domain-containing protein [Armillaria nabsnona]